MGVTVASRQSINSAWPACPNSDASWSMSPPGTPVANVSAAEAARATSARSSGSPPRARASATARAELDESPDPTGTVERTSTSTGATVSPRSRRARTAPATNRPHGGSTVEGSVVPSAATATSPASWADAARTACASVGGPTRTVQARSIASGRTKPSL